MNYRIGTKDSGMVMSKDFIVGIKPGGEECIIPIDAKNYDYQIYLEWLADGNTPDPAE